MRRVLSKRFESVASVAIIALFAGVAMFSNGGRLAYFGDHSLNHLTNIEAIPAGSPVYAENRWKGQSIWTPVVFAADGSLTLKDFVRQMYEKTFPDRLLERTPNAKANVHVVARHKDGTVFLDTWTHNLRTNAGINWQEGLMAASSGANSCTYIALSNSGATPAATDTTLASEITSNGLARATGTVTHRLECHDLHAGEHLHGHGHASGAERRDVQQHLRQRRHALFREHLYAGVAGERGHAHGDLDDNFLKNR